MGKSKNTNKQTRSPAPASTTRAPAPAAASAPRPALPAKAIEEIEAQSQHLGVADVEVPPKPDEPVDYQVLWMKANHAKDRYEAARRQQEELKEMHHVDLAEVRGREAQVKKDRGALTLEQARLGQLEQELAKRELNAQAGFERERQAMLADLQQVSEAQRAEWRSLERDIAARRRAADDELRERQANEDRQHAVARAQLLAELHADRLAFQRECNEREAERQRQLDQRDTERRRQLDEREHVVDQRQLQLDQAEAELRRRTRRVELDHEEINERNDELDETIERGLAAERERFEFELRATQARLEAAQIDRDRLDEQRRAREDADRRMGPHTLEQLIAERDRLRVDNEALERELAERPAIDEVAELRRNTEELDSIRQDRRRLQDELTREREQSNRLRIAEREVETMQLNRDAMQAVVEALRETIEELRRELDDLHARAQALTAFPQCAAMDSTPELQREDETESIVDLEEFVEKLRARMASGTAARFYTPADIRSFLGGLAMGSLLLLQGFSGTGKTSLPIAFAEAVGTVGTKATVVEVQAGWRDPQDLIGHYNSFERRFYESELLQGLYRAQTPAWRDRIHIVVLDEMNLAHPEQYFSDFLSALERNLDEQLITLTTNALPNAPKLLLEGRKLRIPRNVWFVGTANHDETTKGFADKTYDRAHVMSLPETPPPPGRVQSQGGAPISHASLRACFERAQRTHASAAAEALECLTELRPNLRESFQIAWGPRLERQLRAFVPVIVAAGGSVGEATDHVLTYRLLRKLEGRYDNRIPDLERLREQVERALSTLNPPAKPASLKLLDQELRRRDPERERAQ